MAKAKAKYSTLKFLNPKKLGNLFAMPVSGDCMEPEIKSGSKVIVDKTQKFKPGDFVVFFLKPKYVAKGHLQAALKRLVLYAKPGSGFQPGIMVETLNPPRKYWVPEERLMGVYKATLPGERDFIYRAKYPKKAVTGTYRVPASNLRAGAWG